jgi:hypothetical protein
MSLTTVYVSSLDIQSTPNTIRTRSSSSIKTSGSIGVLSIDKTAPTIEFKRKSVGVYSGSDPNFELSVPITRQYSSYGLDSEGNDANTFIGYEDDFSEDTVSSYTITSSGGTSTTYDSGNQWLFFSGADNENQTLDYTFEGTLTTGIFRARIQKTGEYPLDNSNSIKLYNSTTGKSQDFYYVVFNGSNYQSTMDKDYNGSTETQNISYNFDDQSKFYTFELRFSPESFSFYVDDVLQSTFDTTNNDSIDIDSVEIYFLQFNGRLNLIHFSENGTISQNTIGYTDLSSSSNTSITLPVFANNTLLRAKTILDISSSTKPKSFSATSVNKDLKILSIDKTNLLQRDTAFDIVNEDNDPRLDRSPRPAGETQQQSNNNVVVAQTQIWI